MKLKLKLPKIGARTVKTAIAATACLLLFMGLDYIGGLLMQSDTFWSHVGQFLTMQEPTFGCVAAVICMQQTVKNSLQSGAYRLLGTAVGGAVGILFLWINQIVLSGRLHILWVVIGIILSIWLVLLMKRPDSAAICAVTLLIVMLTADKDSPYIYAINRIVGTLLGIAVSVAVNGLVKPPNSTPCADPLR